VLLGITGLGFGAQQVLPFAMLTDIISSHVAAAKGHHRFWVANEKLGLALGPLVAGLILQLCGFRERPSSTILQPANAIFGIRVAFSLIPALLLMTSALLLTRCRNPQPAPPVARKQAGM